MPLTNENPSDKFYIVLDIANNRDVDIQFILEPNGSSYRMDAHTRFKIIVEAMHKDSQYTVDLTSDTEIILYTPSIVEWIYEGKLLIHTVTKRLPPEQFIPR